MSDEVWFVFVKSVSTAASVICMGELSSWMMLALRFVSNHREKPVVARMPPLVMLICVMMASVFGHSNRQWCRESCPMLQNGQAVQSLWWSCWLPLSMYLDMRRIFSPSTQPTAWLSSNVEEEMRPIQSRIISACRLGWRASHVLLVIVMSTSPDLAMYASLRHGW